MSGIWLPHTKRKILPNLDHGPRPRTEGVVIHSTEGDGMPTGWFANLHRPEPGVGAHAAFSTHEAVQYVDLSRKAWHAGEGNAAWIGFEHVAFARWTHDQWLAHERMLVLSANRTAWVLHEYHLGRPRYGKNIRSHASGGAAWGGHHDPGAHFPWPHYMRLVEDAYIEHWGRG